MDPKIIPYGNRIVVRPIREEEVLASGLVIPDTAKDKPQQGDVVGVGPGRIDDNGKRIPLEVAVGDRILFGRYAGNEIKLGNDEYLVLSESDILAKLES